MKGAHFSSVLLWGLCMRVNAFTEVTLQISSSSTGTVTPSDAESLGTEVSMTSQKSSMLTFRNCNTLKGTDAITKDVEASLANSPSPVIVITDVTNNLTWNKTSSNEHNERVSSAGSTDLISQIPAQSLREEATIPPELDTVFNSFISLSFVSTTHDQSMSAESILSVPDVVNSSSPAELSFSLEPEIIQALSEYGVVDHTLSDDGSVSLDHSLLHESVGGNTVSANFTYLVQSQSNLSQMAGYVFLYDTSSPSIATSDPDESPPGDARGFMSFEEWKKLKQTPNNSSSNNTKSRLGQLSTVAKLGGSPKSVRVNRFNFALADCAATIVDTSAKGAGAILKENKDLYMLTECSQRNKFVVIELCQEILVDSIVVGNYEFFSSQFKQIRALVLALFPSSDWRVLGDFHADNIRNIQLFGVEKPQIWARYLKLEVISHYGNEFYCPISIVRVHGKTMMEEAKEDQESDIHEVDVEVMQPPKLEKCAVVFPYLGLSEFLQDMNSTTNSTGPIGVDLCEVDFSTEGAAESVTSLGSGSQSVYKTIMKRLLLLETNASLLLLYIEEQLKLLSMAFTNLESRQAANFEVLVASFNHTISSQLALFKKNYASMHQEYSKLLKLQSQGHAGLVLDTKNKIGFVTRELLFQQRVSLFNLVIIICMLVYVVITRQTYIDDIKDRHRNQEQMLPSIRAKRQFEVKRPMRRRRVDRVYYVHR